MARQLKRSTVLSIAVVLAAMCLTVRPARAAIVMVNSLNDVDDSVCDVTHCSLREAVTYAPANDTINFSVTGTITLTGGEIPITRSMNIAGPGAGALTINGSNINRVFRTIVGTTVNISGLTFQNGIVGGGSGGAILNFGTMTVTGCVFTSNSAIIGGAIDNSGTLDITNTTFSGNNGTSAGGAILNNIGATMTLTNSTISGNTAIIGGGLENNGTMTVNNSIFSGNIATLGGGGIQNVATLVVTNSTISGNTTSFNGGGLQSLGAGTLVTVTGTLFSGNTGGTGGAIVADNGSVSASCIEANTTNFGFGYDAQMGTGTFTANGNWWGDPLGPNQGVAETTDAPFAPFLTAAPACGAVIVSAAGAKDVCLSDDRINCHHGDWLAVVYVGEDDQGEAAIDIYCVDLAGKGYFGMQVTQADIDQFPPEPEVDTLVKETDNCRVPVRFYILTTGEYQINIGPDYEGKVEVIVFTGLPPVDIYFLRFTE